MEVGSSPIWKVVELDHLCLLLFQCVPYRVASVGYCLCEYDHDFFSSLVRTLEVRQSSMSYQCLMSLVAAFIHHFMKVWLLKSQDFFSSVFWRGHCGRLSNRFWQTWGGNASISSRVKRLRGEFFNPHSIIYLPTLTPASSAYFWSCGHSSSVQR